MRILLITGLLLATAVVLAACGGGTSLQPAPQASEDVVLSGMILESGGLRSTSTLSGVGGAELSLISVADGELLSSQITDPDGSFEFASVEPGDALLTIEFDSAADLDGDLLSDEVAFTTPVALEPGSTGEFIGTFDLWDINQDGMDDGVELTTVLVDDLGTNQEDSRLVVPAEQMVFFDTDGDGYFSDEYGYVDADGDGLPDELVGHMNSLHGGMLKGPIEEITDDSLTVEGIIFTVTEATGWKDKGNKEPDMEVFVEGVNVLVRGFWNGTEWIALEVKTTGVRGEGDGGGDDDDGSGGDDDDDGSGTIILF